MLPFESIPSLFIDANGVLSQFKRLNTNKAHEHDEHSSQLLKLVVVDLAVFCIDNQISTV